MLLVFNPITKGYKMEPPIFVVKFTKRRDIGDVLKAGRYDDINFLIRDGIKKKRLSLRDEEIGDRKITLLGFDYHINFQEVLIEARRQRLILPSLGDPFLFGEQEPNEQKQGSIVFLHDPSYFWSGCSFQLMLGLNSKGRNISFVSSGSEWPKGCRFAFRSK